MSKPNVNTNPVANQYTSRNERIVEYSSPNGGGLIRFTVLDDGTLAVGLYGHDETVKISVSDSR